MQYFRRRDEPRGHELLLTLRRRILLGQWRNQRPERELVHWPLRIAQLIASDLETQIIFVSLGEFDTHQALLAELSSAVRAFYRDLQGHGLDQRVTLATFSEFGRRVKENGSLGTDHGAASQMFVVTPKKGGV